MARWEVELLWWVSGAFVMYAVAISLFTIAMHLSHYTVHQHQRFIVRILIMVPVYAIDAWFSLRFLEIGAYLELIRHCYEAYTLYLFFMLLVNYLEGEENIIAIFESKPAIPHPWPLNSFTFQPNRQFYYQCKTFILQFTLVQLFCGVLTFFLSIIGEYEEGSFSPSSSYLWIMLITNLSITVSLYYLVLFALALEDELEPFNPIGKFLCIKSVIFFAFWQGVFFAILVAAGAIPEGASWSPENLSSAIQNFLICIEMYFLSIGFVYSFHWAPYENPIVGGGLPRIRPLLRSTSDVLNIKDTIDDTRDTFSASRLSESFSVVGAIRQSFSSAPASQPPV